MSLASTATAGHLHPSDPPAPTMHTLGEIYDQIQALSGSTATIPAESIFGVSTDINMSMVDIQGSCTIERREDTINVMGYEHDDSLAFDAQSGTADRKVHNPLKIVKYIDRATPLLFSALVTGQQIHQNQIDFHRTDASGDEIVYYTIELENTLIVQIESSSPNFEKVSFVYEKIKWTYEDGGGHIEGDDDWRYLPQT